MLLGRLFSSWLAGSPLVNFRRQPRNGSGFAVGPLGVAPFFNFIIDLPQVSISGKRIHDVLSLIPSCSAESIRERPRFNTFNLPWNDLHDTSLTLHNQRIFSAEANYEFQLPLKDDRIAVSNLGRRVNEGLHELFVSLILIQPSRDGPKSIPASDAT